MKSIKLRYGEEFQTIEVPEQNLLGVVSPKTVDPGDHVSMVNEALNNPIGSPRLGQLLHPGARITVLIDDNTRPTPAHLLLPLLMDRLRAAGIAQKDITILIAGGTHRLMTQKEIEEKVGKGIMAGYRVVMHEWMNEDMLRMIGHTSTGIPVTVNKWVTEADFCIAVGDISPHPLAGWSGGGKMVEPGACGEATTGAVHIGHTFYPSMTFLGIEDCPNRLEIERVAKKAGLKFILNTVLDAEHNLVSVFAGDPVKAHRAGVKAARNIWCAPVSGLADIVVASSYPADHDFWQAEKTMPFMASVVKRGGDIILLTPCPGGISEEPNHREMILKYSRFPSREGLVRAMAAHEWDLAAVNVAVHVAMWRELADVTIVSDGITRADCEAMEVNHASNVNEIFQTVLQKKGPDSKVLVLTHGPKVVPVFAG